MNKTIEKLKIYYDGGKIPMFDERDTEVREKINEIIDELEKIKE